MASLHERIVEARRALMLAGIPEGDAAFDAEVLARHLLGWDRAALLTRWREPAPGDFAARLRPLIARRAAREPVAYITGHREFWGLDFEVTPDVLIPRPETELIVEEARRWSKRAGAPSAITDVGTGSGCIAIALALEFPGASVTATDISPRALDVAARNAARHGVADRIRFVTADLLDASLPGPADLIVSNPPYVSDRDREFLQAEVVCHEPASALFGGPDEGLGVVRRLLACASGHLAPRGALVMEFGDGQEEGVRSGARDAGWRVDRIGRDLQDIARVAVLRR